MALHAPAAPRCAHHSLHLEIGDEVCWRSRWHEVLDFTQQGEPVIMTTPGSFVCLDTDEITAWRRPEMAPVIPLRLLPPLSVHLRGGPRLL